MLGKSGNLVNSRPTAHALTCSIACAAQQLIGHTPTRESEGKNELKTEMRIFPPLNPAAAFQLEFSLLACLLPITAGTAATRHAGILQNSRSNSISFSEYTMPEGLETLPPEVFLRIIQEVGGLLSRQE